MTTIEGNKLIADFMGYIHSRHAEFDKHEMENLQYHTRWDALMPVVEKLLAEPGVDIAFDLGFCRIQRQYVPPLFDAFFHSETTIGAMWQAIIAFIEFYNKFSITDKAKQK